MIFKCFDSVDTVTKCEKSSVRRNMKLTATQTLDILRFFLQKQVQRPGRGRASKSELWYSLIQSSPREAVVQWIFHHSRNSEERQIDPWAQRKALGGVPSIRNISILLLFFFLMKRLPRVTFYTLEGARNNTVDILVFCWISLNLASTFSLNAGGLFFGVEYFISISTTMRAKDLVVLL